jgi:membrane associated rhomboid family serine protease
VTGESGEARATRPWATWLAATVCVAVFLVATLVGRGAVRGLAGSTLDVWHGRWWLLVTSAFVHFEVLHVAFNLYWLLRLGRVLETAIGPARWALLCLTAAFVSSAAQMAWSDQTGIGFSGVGYAFFGFMWVARGRWPAFARAVNRDTVLLFLAWLVGCMVMTAMDMWRVANAAHVGGLVYGLLLGAAVVVRRGRIAAFGGAGALFAASVMLLFYAPWSPTWNGVRAYRLHMQRDYADAERAYLRALELGHQPAWVWRNLALLYRAERRKDRYDEALRHLREVDPEAAEKLSAGK